VDQAHLEPGQRVRWRGRRWRVDRLGGDGFVTLLGLDEVNRNQKVTPLLALEAGALEPDVLPLPVLDFHRSDRAYWRAVHQAFTVTMAAGREQLIGLDWGAIAVEPYQLVPLMRMARSVRPRLLIADDTGLGKTAEAGIVLRWLARRHQGGRMLIVTRASPEPERWRSEMWTKFGFRFDILKSGSDFNERRRQSPTVNVFAQQSHLIASMTLLARQALLDELRKCPAPFDVIVVDEAHHLAQRGNRTKRLALLGRELASKSQDGALLLLTATPHDGKTDSFLSLLRLLDPLVDLRDGEVPVEVASRLVVRRLKSEVTLSGGRRFQVPKIQVVSTLRYASTPEKAIDAPLDAYLEWLKQEEDRYEDEGARAKAKGCQFLAGVLRKRLGSSVAALRATLRRRLGQPPAPEDLDEAVPFVEDDSSDPEDEVIDPGAAAESPPPPLVAEEQQLAATVLTAAERVAAGRDSKLEAAVRLLQGDLASEKVVIFTEYRDTLRAARRRLAEAGIPLVVYHGGTPEKDRAEAERAFQHDPTVRVFLATDAASEGKNLQHSAHHLMHLDVPWNPNRYAQRNGRIDRYGQDHRPHVWALVAADRSNRQGRPESRALELIVEKLRTIEKEVGSVAPVLPGFASGTVADVLRAGDPDAERKVDDLMSNSTARRVQEDLSLLALENQREIRDAQGYAESLGPTDDFGEEVGGVLRQAFRAWDDGGAIEPLREEPGLFRVQIPARLRAALRTSLIPRATFRRDLAVRGQEADEVTAPEFLSPAHPLVEHTLRALRDETGRPDCPHRFDVEAGDPEGLVLSFLLRFVDGDGRTVAERLEAVEVGRDGTASPNGQAAGSRLGIDAPNTILRPDAAAIERWRPLFPTQVPSARVEAERRAEAYRQELAEAADALREEELRTLALWHADQVGRAQVLTLGTGQLSLDNYPEYEERLRRLQLEYEARKTFLRDRSRIKLAGVELIGGRLYVRGQR